MGDVDMTPSDDGLNPTQHSGAAHAGSQNEARPLCPIPSLLVFARDLLQPAYVKNGAGEFLYVNEAFCRLTRREAIELVGHTELQTFGEYNDVSETRVSFTPPRHRFGLPEAPRVTELRPPTDDDIAEPCLGVVCQQDGELGRFASAREEQIKAAQQELLRKERLMVLGQLAAGLAHQIRNPLAAIANAVAIARRRTPEANQRVHEALRIASDEVWEANRTIGDLLEFARIRPAQPGEVQLPLLVARALEAEPLPETIRVELDVPDVSVLVDERQVRDAMRNLVRNAREAMRDEGSLFITATVRAGYAELRIRDTGEGIAEDSQHLLFEPLVTSKPLGIGLGLSTARALVANQGGTLEFVTQSQGGACFVLRLPLTPVHPALG